MKQEYLDIIDLPRFEPKKHPRMSMENRAAQFSPFAALTGFDDELNEAARYTQQETQLSETQAQEIDAMLKRLSERPREASFTLFVPDTKKEGGSYRIVRGKIKRIDAINKTITLENGAVLSMTQLRNIE